MEQDPDLALDSLSVGERLKQAREAKGMSLDDVASQTRIPIRHLQHIEREEWDALPAVTYSVGFARNYANAVGLDGSEIARELRERIGGTRTRTPMPEYYEPADPARVPPRALAIAAVILAALMIAGYFLWRGSLGDGGADPVVAEAPPPAGQAPAARPQPIAPGAAAGQPVVLVATEEVWLRIRDGANGPTLFEAVLRAGERYQVPPTAQRPVIRTGRPQVLRVAVGGRDLGPLEPVERTVSDVSLRPEDLARRARSAAPPPG